MENYFYEAFNALKRQGPGSDESTRKAISLLALNRDKAINILDIGCGNGTQTLILAEHFPNAQIIAIDTNPDSLHHLKKRKDQQSLTDRITIENISMFNIPFEPEAFDLIWVEGAIYIIGFEQGLKQWKKYLKKGGYLACSEISWLHDHVSEESKAFWNEGYPEIDTIANKINLITKLGYNYHFNFVLPKSDWVDPYYQPLEESLQQMEHKYNNNNEALTVIHMIREEINIYQRNSHDYSYGFYGMQKREKGNHTNHCVVLNKDRFI